MWVSQTHRVVVKRTGKRKGKAGNETGMSVGEVRWGRVKMGEGLAGWGWPEGTTRFQALVPGE